MRDRAEAIAAGALIAYLAAFPLAAIFDRAFGAAAASSVLLALYLGSLVGAFAVGALAVRRAPTADRLRRALTLAAIVTVAGVLTFLLVAAPTDRASGGIAYATQVGGLAVLLAVPLAVRESRRRFAGTGRAGLGLRTAGAAGAAALALVFTLTWVPFLVDGYVNVDSAIGWTTTTLLVGLVCLGSAAAVWTARDGRHALGSALAISGLTGVAGPILLYVLRATSLARPTAAIRADWNEENALLGVVVVAACAVWGIASAVAGILLLARARVARPA